MLDPDVHLKNIIYLNYLKKKSSPSIPLFIFIEIEDLFDDQKIRDCLLNN